METAVNGADVAPGSDRPPGMVDLVLLATDLSPTSGPAASEAIRLAGTTGAQLIVLSVIEPRRLRLPGGRLRRRLDEERSRIEAGVQELVARARSAGLRSTYLIFEGEPAEAILAAADAEEVDLIVLGSGARSAPGLIPVGSTSMRVRDLTTRPVLFISA